MERLEAELVIVHMVLLDLIVINVVLDFLEAIVLTNVIVKMEFVLKV
jgi:hypothetical protein